MIVDTHAHLDADAFDADRDEVVRRAVDAGVTRIVTIGVDLESSREGVELADRHPEVARELQKDFTRWREAMAPRISKKRKARRLPKERRKP